MRIEERERIVLGSRTRAQARVAFEENDRAPFTLFFEAGPPLGDVLEPTPELFVACAYPIALWMGERRLRVEGALDSTLATGLLQAAALLRAWYPHCGHVALEAAEGLRALRPRVEPHAAALFSGGVDATAMLRENRDTLPLDHPRSLRSVLYTFGNLLIDRIGDEENPAMRARYEAQVRRLERLGEQVDVRVVTAETNVPRLHPDPACFYRAAFSGSYLAPLVGTPAFVTDAMLGSSAEGPAESFPHGSFPLLDVHYATGAVRVHHAQPLLTRLEKVRRIADFEPAYATLQVCNRPDVCAVDQVNCGRCEKCVRTMLELLVCGALERFSAFDDDDVTPGMFDDLRLATIHPYYTEPDLVDGLRRLGRDDLLRAIRRRLRYVTGPAPIRELLRLKQRLTRRWKAVGRTGRPE